MDAPVERVIMFVALVFLTTGVTATVLAMPKMPAPDATAAENTINKGAASPHGVALEYDHNADAVKVSEKQFRLRNDGGESQGSVSFGVITPVKTDEKFYKDLEAVARQSSWDAVFETKQAFIETAREARMDTTDGDLDWHEASGTLHVKTVVFDNAKVTIVAF